jgi:hypothetical protein
MAKPKKDYGQGDKAGRLIEFILGRKDAYYNANVTKRWREACYGIECALDQKFTEEEEDLTRSKFYVSRLIQSDDALIETATDAYTMANPLLVLGTKRRGTQDFAERSGSLMHNVWEEGESMDPWLSFMRDINRHGMGVGYTRFEKEDGQTLGMKNESMPWGMLSTVALQNKTLLSRAVIERFHPLDWWGYWRTHLTPPWEGVTRQYGACDLLALDGDPDYSRKGIALELERIKKGGGPEDEYYHGADEEDEEIPDHNTIMAYEYWGDLYGLPGYESDRSEYQVIITDAVVLMMPRKNPIRGYRPIKRPRGIIVNDWCCGRPALLPQLPAVKIQNFLLNSSLDDVADRLYAGWAVWEKAMQDPDEFLNPSGIGVPVRMTESATPAMLPQRIGGGQSGIQSDVEKIYNGPLEKDIQAGNFADVMSQKGGLQDGTARAANIIASQGARKFKHMAENANRTGLVPMGEQLLLLKILNTDPADLARQTRDGKEFSLSPEELGFLLERNLWDYGESFRRDPYMDAQNMERFAKAGAVEFLGNFTKTPALQAKFWRAYGKNLNVPDYDEYLPLPPEEGAPQPQPQGIPPELGGQGAPPPPEPGAEVPELQAAA